MQPQNNLPKHENEEVKSVGTCKCCIYLCLSLIAAESSPFRSSAKGITNCNPLSPGCDSISSLIDTSQSVVPDNDHLNLNPFAQGNNC